MATVPGPQVAGIAMAFVIKLSSMKVTGTATEGVTVFDRFLADYQTAEPTIRTLDGAVIDISNRSVGLLPS